MQFSYRCSDCGQHYTIDPKLTVSLEIFQQLGGVPDYLFVATGDGCILSGVYKGFQDLRRLKLIDRIPTVISVQAAGSDARYRAFKIMAELPPAAGIVIPATGNGLKDSTAAGRGINVPAATIQSLSDIRKGS